MPVTREDVKVLIARKDALQVQMDANLQVLRQNNIDRKEPLVDDAGYPRSDIDVFSVRHARHDLICQENDMKALMTEIEQALHELHQSEKDNIVDTDTKPPPKRTSNKVFAVVSQIADGSPAGEAGFVEGDRLIEFGSANADTFKDIKQVAEIVQHSTQTSIRVTVVRDDRPVHLTLKPRQWQGRGLLGCMVTPLT